ncbi:hypothetical protein [Halopiger xanaduensis]|uniref:hypothetical protein n=1 Tax=Halopiger xanaduensis TaxID=387343 RepID=UPI000A002AB8|nr:hypothetical protein [Halopiger xanaduensis]
MTDDERSPDPHDVPGFNRAVGVDEPVLDTEYGDQGVCPERRATDGGNPPVDDLHGALLETKYELQQLEAQLPEPLSLTDAIRELDATADAYSRLRFNDQ